MRPRRLSEVAAAVGGRLDGEDADVDLGRDRQPRAPGRATCSSRSPASTPTATSSWRRRSRAARRARSFATDRGRRARPCGSRDTGRRAARPGGATSGAGSTATVVGDHRGERQDLDEGPRRGGARHAAAARTRARRRSTTRSACRSRSSGARRTPRSSSCEMGARGSATSALLVRGRPADVVVVTNVGVAHMEIFGSWEAIVEAAARARRGARAPTGVAVLNADDPVVRGFARAHRGARRHRSASAPDADVRAEDVVARRGRARRRFTLVAVERARAGRARGSRGAHGVERARGRRVRSSRSGCTAAECAAALKGAQRLRVADGDVRDTRTASAS